MSKKEQQLKDAHNRGEKNASEHWSGDRNPWNPFETRYDPPRNPEERKSYDRGWKNTEKQIF